MNGEHGVNWNELQKVWSIPEPWSMRPITQGDNNLTQVMATPLGNYIVRAYHRNRTLERIRYELGILRNLQEKTLPFHIPAPIPTVTGDLFAVLSGTLVTISPWLSGSAPRSDNLNQAHAAGQALAELVEALADARVDVTSQSAPFPPSSNFEAWAGIPIDPVQIIAQLPMTKEYQKRTISLLEAAQVSAPALYQNLPQQIIHRDYDQSNILMEGDWVTGVLDFEFCGYDLRILDLAYALSHWPDGLWNTGKEWLVIDAFGQGFLQRQRLTLEELEALPLVFWLRASTSLFFRLGRYAQGVETQESLIDRIQETLTNESWLQRNADELSDRARSWLH